MRLEQVVLHGPGEDDRVRFGDGLTVFAGLGERERLDLIETVALALTGGLPNASVVYHDHAGRRVFADRTGATYAITGAEAPGPGRLLGQDPEAIIRLFTVTDDELGLGAESSPEDIEQALEAARTELERARAEFDDLREQTGLMGAWQEELEILNRRILQAQDHAARWAWVQAHQRLQQLQAELSVLGEDGAEDQDRLVLAAVDALRTLGEAWTDAAAAAGELRNAIVAELGTIPEVEHAAPRTGGGHPDDGPEPVPEALAMWKAAADLREETADALRRVDNPTPESEDPLVVAFAECDQEQLWLAHAQLEAANASYAQTDRQLQPAATPTPGRARRSRPPTARWSAASATSSAASAPAILGSAARSPSPPSSPARRSRCCWASSSCWPPWARACGSWPSPAGTSPRPCSWRSWP